MQKKQCAHWLALVLVISLKRCTYQSKANTVRNTPELFKRTAREERGYVDIVSFLKTNKKKHEEEEEFDLFASYAAYENYCLVGESCESQGRHDDNHKKYLQQGKENR